MAEIGNLGKKLQLLLPLIETYKKLEQVEMNRKYKLTNYRLMLFQSPLYYLYSTSVVFIFLSFDASPALVDLSLGGMVVRLNTLKENHKYI